MDVLEEGCDGAESSSLPGLGDEGNDLMGVIPAPEAGVVEPQSPVAKAGDSSESSTNSTPHHSPARPSGGRAREVQSASTGIVAKARRKDFYSKTAKGFIIPREDIPEPISERGRNKHVPRNIEEEVLSGVSPITVPTSSKERSKVALSTAASALIHPHDSHVMLNTPPDVRWSIHASGGVETASRTGSGETDNEEGDERCWLFLRVKSYDIRQDATGPPYQIYILEAWHGAKKWSVERRLEDFHALSERLLAKIDPRILPSSPQKPHGGWFRGLGSGVDDVDETRSQLDTYVCALASLAMQLETDVSTRGKGDEALMHLVHCLYEFADFVQGSGSCRSRLARNMSTPLPSPVQPERCEADDVIMMPTPSENSQDHDIEVLLGAKQELQRLKAMLKEVEEKGRAEADIKRDMGKAVVSLTEQLQAVEKKKRILKARLVEVLKGPHRNEEDAESLSAIWQRLWRVRAKVMYSVLAKGRAREGQDDGYNDPIPISQAGERWGSSSGAEEEGKEANELEEVGDVEELEAIEREAGERCAPPLDGGVGKERLLSVQATQLVAENATMWRWFADVAASWMRAKAKSETISGWKRRKNVSFSNYNKDYELPADERDAGPGAGEDQGLVSGAGGAGGDGQNEDGGQEAGEDGESRKDLGRGGGGDASPGDGDAGDAAAAADAMTRSDDVPPDAAVPAISSTPPRSSSARDSQGSGHAQGALLLSGSAGPGDWPSCEEDCAKPPSDVVLRVASQMFQTMDGMRAQLAKELRQLASLKEDAKALNYTIELAKKDIIATRAERDAHRRAIEASDAEIRRLSGLRLPCSPSPSQPAGSRQDTPNTNVGSRPATPQSAVKYVHPEKQSRHQDHHNTGKMAAGKEGGDSDEDERLELEGLSGTR